MRLAFLPSLITLAGCGFSAPQSLSGDAGPDDAAVDGRAPDVVDAPDPDGPATDASAIDAATPIDAAPVDAVIPIDAPIPIDAAIPIDAPPPIDAAIPIDAAPPIDAPPPTDTCSTDANLIACYGFQGTTLDGSGHGLDATSSNVSYVTGRVGMGAGIAANTTIHVADSPLIDVTAVTVEVFVRADAPPTGTARQGILDIPGQVALFLYNGELRCFTDTWHARPITLGTGQWHHLACTYANGTTTLYRDGVALGAAFTGGGPLPTSGTSGMTIGGNDPTGERVLGAIDEFRYWKVARSTAQICADANAGGLCP